MLSLWKGGCDGDFGKASGWDGWGEPESRSFLL